MVHRFAWRIGWYGCVCIPQPANLLIYFCIKMLPIATVQGVRDGISTGMIIDLSEYLKKSEGVSKEEANALEAALKEAGAEVEVK